MILARWKNRWFLASRARPDTPSCSLLAGDWEGLLDLGFSREERSIGRKGDPEFRAWFRWWRTMPTTEGIDFFPELRYRGIRVYPEHWHQTSRDPLLHCRMMGDQISHATMTPEFLAAREALDRAGAQRKVGADDPLFIRWRELVGRVTLAGDELRRCLVEEGWRDEWREGLTRFVHVDELEKVEGPPPQGEPW